MRMDDVHGTSMDQKHALLSYPNFARASDVTELPGKKTVLVQKIFKTKTPLIFKEVMLLFQQFPLKF